MERASPELRQQARSLRSQYHERIVREVGEAQNALNARGASLEEYAKGSYDVRVTLRQAERDYFPKEFRHLFDKSDAGVPGSFGGMVEKYVDRGMTRDQALRTIAGNARTATNKAVDEVIFRRYPGE